MKKLFILSLTFPCFISCSLFADLVYFDDGVSRTINDDTYINSVIFLDENNPNGPVTHLEVSTGGVIGHVEAHNNSTANINDGQFETVTAFNNSTVNINDGFFTIGIAGIDNSVVTISGGQAVQLVAAGNSTITVSDTASFWSVFPEGNSSVTFNGGFINDRLWAFENSIVSIRGGEFYRLDDIPPNQDFGFVTDFVAAEQSTIYLYGNNFSVGGVALDYGDNLRDFGGGGIITGVLSDGSLLNNYFGLSDEANIIIIPEPTTLLLFGLGGLVLRARRK